MSSSAGCVRMRRTLIRMSALASSMRLISTIVLSGPFKVDMMPVPRRPTTATAPKSVKKILPRSRLLFLSFDDLIISSLPFFVSSCWRFIF